MVLTSRDKTTVAIIPCAACRLIYCSTITTSKARSTRDIVAPTIRAKLPREENFDN